MERKGVCALKSVSSSELFFTYFLIILRNNSALKAGSIVYTVSIKWTHCVVFLPVEIIVVLLELTKPVCNLLFGHLMAVCSCVLYIESWFHPLSFGNRFWGKREGADRVKDREDKYGSYMEQERREGEQR